VGRHRQDGRHGDAGQAAQNLCDVSQPDGVLARQPRLLAPYQQVPVPVHAQLPNKRSELLLATGTCSEEGAEPQEHHASLGLQRLDLQKLHPGQSRQTSSIADRRCPR